MANDDASAGGQVTMLADNPDSPEDSPPVSIAEEAPQEPELMPRPTKPVARLATLVGVAIVVLLASLTGWLGFRAHKAHDAQAQRSQFVQAARQSALNLTTIDWKNADADVRRILDGATGTFYDDFAKRSQPFVDVVKRAKSTTAGTVTEAGLESETAGTARVLVAVTVKTSTAGAPDNNLRSWRMRFSVQQDGNETKVSNVEFVP